MNWLKFIKEEEQNPNAELGKHNNGGGYFMPFREYKGKFNDAPISVTIDDTSCGEFGSRYNVYVDFNGIEYEYHYNSMISDIYEEGNIPKDIAEFIKNETGYFCFH